MDDEYLHGFYLGDLHVEPLKGRVSDGEHAEHLPPKAIEVLVCLARRPGEIVSYEELLECAWGEGAGTREALGHVITQVRHALGDHADKPAYIQTLPRRGYRLVVEPVPADGRTDDNTAISDLGVFENLKRRGVLETAAAYLVLGWLIIQVVDVVFDRLNFPDWVATFVTVLVIAGFPIAIALSWFLEIRGGNAVLDDLSPRDSRRRRFSRTYVSVVASLGIAGMLVFAYDKLIGLPYPEVVETSTLPTPEVTVEENSIAVLPFLNNDGSDETQIFANGLVDDVITRLSRVPGVLVSSRGDSSTLQPNSASDRVRQRLRVAMYLEGSVEMHGDEIRIIVQLIDSATGFHILSRTFDRPRTDFFDIRDEITQLTVSLLRVALPGQEATWIAGNERDPEFDAYLPYRRGIDALDQAITLDSLAEAMGWFDTALEIDPEFAAAQAGRCRTFVLQFIEVKEAESITNAETACAAALDLNPNLDVVHEALGKLYFETGRIGDAERAYLSALRINDRNVDAMIGISHVYRLQQRPDAAEAILAEAAGLQPGNWRIYMNLGIFHYREGNFEDAARMFAEVVSIDPDNVRALSNLGSSQMMAGDFNSALATYQRSVDAAPDRFAYANLGLMNYYLGNYEDAEAAVRKAIEMAPRDHLNWSNLGDILQVADKTDEAREAYRRAEQLVEDRIAVNPTDPGSQMDHAWIHAMLGDKDKAMAEIGAALGGAPNDPYAHYIEGLIMNRFGNTEAALASFERAVDNGYSRAILRAEPLLLSLREDARFERLTLANREEK